MGESHFIYLSIQFNKAEKSEVASVCVFEKLFSFSSKSG